jgi:hypothetical protein
MGFFLKKKADSFSVSFPHEETANSVALGLGGLQSVAGT